MPCNCLEKNWVDIPHEHPKPSPTTTCLFCAEKHAAAAAVLDLEDGYADLNRPYIVGQLVAASLHLHPADPLKTTLRDARLAVQSRDPSAPPVDWDAILSAIADRIAAADRDAAETAIALAETPEEK